MTVHATPPTVAVDMGVKRAPFRLMLWFEPVLKLFGEVDQIIGVGCWMVTADVPKMPDGELVAFTVTTFGEGTIAGAV